MAEKIISLESPEYPTQEINESDGDFLERKIDYYERTIAYDAFVSQWWEEPLQEMMKDLVYVSVEWARLVPDKREEERYRHPTWWNDLDRYIGVLE